MMQEWDDIDLLEVTSAFQGFTIPKREIYAEIEKRGWEVQNLSFKTDKYIAKGKSPIGDTLESDGPTDDSALGNLLISIMRKEYIRPTVHRTAAWHEHYQKPGMLQSLAEAYANGPVYDAKAAPAWKELAEDSRRRADEVRRQIRVDVVDDPEPYKDAREMQEDIHKNRHFSVSRANSDHPIWSPEDNVNFRIVHDVLGHAPAGGNFDWMGETQACGKHLPLLSPNAQRALATECFTGDSLVRTRDGLRPISEIKVGDYVLSGNGEYNRVYQTFERDYDGEIVNLDVKTGVRPIGVTPNHAFLALNSSHRKTRSDSKREVRQQCSPGTCNRAKDASKWHSTEWQEIGNLGVNDYLVTRVPNQYFDFNTIHIPDKYRGSKCGSRSMREGEYRRSGPMQFDLTPDFLWAIGLFIAEGSSRDAGLSYGLHEDEIEYIDRIQRIWREYGYSVSFRNQPSKGVEITIHSAALGEWFSDWIGKGSHNKIIPNELFNLPIDKVCYIVEGIADGDGYKRKNVLGQTSEILAAQVLEISLRQGGRPYNWIARPKNKKVAYYVGNAFHHWDDYSTKLKGYWDICNERMGIIRATERVHYAGKVYDLGVENEHTYVINNVVVHNCLGQTAYAAHYRDFGPQKIFFMDDHIEPYQNIENPVGHQGVHPSQTLVGTSGPEVPTPDYEGFGALPQGTIAPHHEDAIKGAPGFSPQYPGSSGFTSFGTKIAAVPVDPNADWKSGVDPLPDNAYMWQTNPTTGAPPLNVEATKDLAHKLQTDWHQMDRDTAKQAVVNAVRAAILSPKQDLRWNAVTYQDVSHIPPSVTDPKRFWDAIQVAQERWNGARGHESRSHKVWYPSFVKYKQMLKATLHESDNEIHDIAERELMHMTSEEQERLSAEKPDIDMFMLEGKVDKALKARLDIMTKTNQIPDLDHGQMQFFAAEEQPELPLDLLPPNPGKYRSGMTGNMKSLAEIGKYADALTDAALEDIQQHNGSGHHFRAAILSMGIRGVGPKVASFAWLLLQPMTSQLGTIDSHMAKYVGLDGPPTPRDYFKAERQLQAGRDAAGYGHVPLGQFQWALWDSKRTGENPQDHSALRALNPTPHHDVFWEAPVRDGNWEEPNWWKQTEPARKQVGDQFDEVIAPNFGKTVIPFQKEAVAKKLPQSIPYFVNGDGDEIVGHANQSLMNHLKNQFNLSTNEIWKLPHEVGKH